MWAESLHCSFETLNSIPFALMFPLFYELRNIADLFSRARDKQMVHSDKKNLPGRVLFLRKQMKSNNKYNVKTYMHCGCILPELEEIILLVAQYI